MSIFDHLFGRGVNQPKEPVQPQQSAQPQKPQSQPAKDEPKAAAKDGKAHIYNLIIIDESGSMGHLAEATISGVNETIGAIRQAQKEFGDKQSHYLSLVTFDSPGYGGQAVRTLIDMEPIAQVNDFRDYHPHGCTPLYDAMGMSLTRLHRAIQEDSDATAVVTVVTDGLENSSHEFSGRQLKQLIEQLKEQGWTFSYMGSAHDVKEVTDLLSIDNVMEFSHDNVGARNSWSRESSAKHRFFCKMANEWDDMREDCIDMKRRRFSNFASEYYDGRVTPDPIQSLQPNDVVVSISPAGQSTGHQGQNYYLPQTLDRELFVQEVRKFMVYANAHPELHFLVTLIQSDAFGQSNLGELFEPCVRMENVALPLEFWKKLGLDMLNC